MFFWTQKYPHYDSHCMLVVGYVRYMYQSNGIPSYATYVRLADGWHERANRYASTKYNSGMVTWNYITVSIEK